MKIVFDARGVQGWSDGLSNYVRHIVTALLKLDTANEYVVLLGPALQEHLAAAGVLERPNLRVVATDIPFMGVAQQLRIPRLIRGVAPDATLYHYPHFDMPLFAHPRSVMTVYDLNHISMSGYFDSLRTLKRIYSAGTTWLSLRKTRHIITISETSKQTLLSRFPWLSPSQVTVTYFGVSDRFLVPPDSSRIAAFRERFQLGREPFILYVGTQRPHKNLERLLAAYSRLRHASHLSHRLVLVGSPRQDEKLHRLVQAHALNGAVRHVGYLAEEELPLAYRAADALAFCSLSEGFGMPLLEAMASGVPIVTSDLGAMAEITGGSAVCVDPYSVESIAEGLHRILTSATLRQDLVAKGRERIRDFVWGEAARKTLEVYRRVAEQG